MANVLVQESSLRSIAQAIREKNGTSDTYTPAQMGPAIEALDTGSGEVDGYTKYLYYRLYITDFGRDKNETAQPFQNIASFLVIGPGGTDLAQTYGVSYTASSVVSGGSAANAFDGDPTTLWESDWKNSSDTTGWVQVELDIPRIAVGFVLFTRANQLDYPHEAQIQGSHDGVAWDTLVTIDESNTGRATWQKGCRKAYIVGV